MTAEGLSFQSVQAKWIIAGAPPVNISIEAMQRSVQRLLAGAAAIRRCSGYILVHRTKISAVINFNF